MFCPRGGLNYLTELHESNDNYPLGLKLITIEH